MGLQFCLASTRPWADPTTPTPTLPLSKVLIQSVFFPKHQDKMIVKISLIRSLALQLSADKGTDKR